MATNHPSPSELLVSGTIINGFVKTSIDFQIAAGSALHQSLEQIDPAGWYPLSLLVELQQIVTNNFQTKEPILEKIGRSMMNSWYHHGPGRELIRTGVDFLRYQCGSEGYRSVVRGSDDEVGQFTLSCIDEQAGTAEVRSTTPFNKDMERGIIIGGMSVTGDLDYIEVDNGHDASYFQIRFHARKGLPGDDILEQFLRGERADAPRTLVENLWYRARGLAVELEREKRYFLASQENSQELIARLRDALAKVKTLSGMLPICSSCKKIRDDKGYWDQIEHYISNHSEAEFSHAICPDCARTLYPSYYDRLKGKQEDV
jgi:hypothetical protein